MTQQLEKPKLELENACGLSFKVWTDASKEAGIVPRSAFVDYVRVIKRAWLECHHCVEYQIGNKSELINTRIIIVSDRSNIFYVTDLNISDIQIGKINGL